MNHDLIDIALGVLVGACGWLIQRLVGRVDACEEQLQEQAKTTVIDRAAIRRLEEHLELGPYTLSGNG